MMNYERTCLEREAQRRTEVKTKKNDNISKKKNQ
jgi:hypothetical protein